MDLSPDCLLDNGLGSILVFTNSNQDLSYISDDKTKKSKESIIQRMSEYSEYVFEILDQTKPLNWHEAMISANIDMYFIRLENVDKDSTHEWTSDSNSR